MAKSIADELIAKGRAHGRRKGRQEGLQEGELQGKRESLLRLMRIRYKSLPTEMVERIEQTLSIEQLNAWLDRFVTANSLEDMGIL